MKALQQTIRHWEHVLPYAHIPRNKNEYKELLRLINELMAWLQDHLLDDLAASLLNLIARNIEAYENQHFSTKKTSAIEILKFFMKEHRLEQADLTEIGSQSLVSKILNGERQLTVEHISKLSKKLGVSPAVFFN